MIITTAKPLSDILKRLERHNSIFVVGCAACATKCRTGGEEAVKQMTAELNNAGKKVTGSIILDTPCDMRIAKRDLGRSAEAAAAEALLILACGAGVQAVEKTIGTKPLYPALDPVFIGTTERIGVYHGYCTACGECLLDATGGICPVSRCAKGLSNGPCGGAVNGKCEADPARDCAWALIFEKLNRLSQGMDAVKEYRPPRKNSRQHALNVSGKVKP